MLNAIAILLKRLALRRMDGAVAAVLLIGTMGFGDTATWLQPEQDESPKALFAQPQPASTEGKPTTPKLAYLAVATGPKVITRPFALTSLVLKNSDSRENAAGGSGGATAANPVHFDVSKDQGIALGTGANAPTGGFGAAAAGRSAGPVPEPSQWALIALGLLMVGGLARRSRKVAGGVA